MTLNRTGSGPSNYQTDRQTSTAALATCTITRVFEWLCKKAAPKVLRGRRTGSNLQLVSLSLLEISSDCGLIGDACRIRRVKCLRDDLSMPCTSCIKKQINCTSTYATSKSSRPVKGKRIEGAKQLFGSSQPLPASPSTSSTSTAFDSPLPVELQQHLIDCYFKFIHIRTGLAASL